MSRFEEEVNEAIDDVVIGEALIIEALAERIATKLVASQRALRSEVTIRASYPVEKRTPVTGIPTQEMYGLIGIAAANPATSRRLVGVTRAGHERLPLRAGADLGPGLRGPARGRLLRGGGRAHPRPRAGRDPQPARPRHALPRRPRGHRGGRRRADRDRRGRHVVGDLRAAQAPRRAVRRRPRAPAPALRRGLGARDGARHSLDRFPGLPDDAFVHAHQVNFETIHTHDVEAERSGTIAEIRRELDGGEHVAHHTTLREWLDGRVPRP